MILYVYIIYHDIICDLWINPNSLRTMVCKNRSLPNNSNVWCFGQLVELGTPQAAKDRSSQVGLRGIVLLLQLLRLEGIDLRVCLNCVPVG